MVFSGGISALHESLAPLIPLHNEAKYLYIAIASANLVDMWQLEELHWRLSFLTRLTIGLGLFSFAFSARYFLFPVDAGLAYVTFYSAIILTLYLCGTPIGLFVGLAAGIAGAYFFIPPYGDLKESLFTASSVFFALTVIVMAIVVHRTHHYAKYLQVMLDNDMIGSLRIRDMKILWHNKAITQILGYSSSDLIGASTRILYPDDASFEKVGQSAYPLQKGESFRTQIQFRRKDGELVWIDLSGALLQDRLNDSLWLLHDITELKKLEADLAEQARNDYLTGLPNRRFFIERAAVELYRANRHRQPLSVMMLDIDYFKKVNDTYGHQAGDEVLKSLAHIILATCRQFDIVGRLGGEEFAVLMPATSLEQAVEVAERIRLAVEHHAVALPQGGLPIKFTVSIGVSRLMLETDNIDLILHSADDALYSAKNSGRNKVCVQER